MEIFLIKTLQFMMAISLLVLLHEMGHFLTAKLFGVRVEKFYLFFDPWFHLFEFKPKNSETTYGIGWLPLGGYCKISGMVDESMDTEQLKRDPQPWEFRTKPAWQRLIIMVAGVTVNLLLALFIYSMIMFHWGETYVATKDMTLGMKFNQEAKSYGFHDHDILLGTNLGEFREYNTDVYRDISRADWCDVLRDGKKVRVKLPGGINLLEMFKTSPRFMEPFMVNKVDTVLKRIPVVADSKDSIESPAWKLGLKKGDEIIALNGKSLDSYNNYREATGRIADAMTAAKTRDDSLRLRMVTLAVKRAGTGKVDTMSTTLTADLMMGYAAENPFMKYKQTHISYGFWESFPAGVKYGFDVLGGYVSDMRYVFTSDGVKSLGGFGAIGNLFPDKWDWHAFWMMTAFLSIILAFMNILPIPALDGGFVLFLLFEIITGRKPSDKFMEWAEIFGIGFLLLLMIVANLNDILRWLGYM
ncbi:MAG: RIP metalloprotease RseP [Prevotella sp.]|jgi:regulator of sigma E protease